MNGPGHLVRYAAFLRAVNVGGHSMIRMDILEQRLRDIGLEDVSSYRQSGNLIFSSSISDAASLTRTISGLLEKMTERHPETYVLPLEKLRLVSETDHFDGLAQEGDRRFVTFMSKVPMELPPLPLILQEGIVLVSVEDTMAFTLVRKDFASAPVNDVLEKRFGTKATTRNMTTVSGLVQKADGDKSQ